MKRFQHLHSVVRPGSAGIEIGPWRHPVAPKRDGYQTLVVDILDTEGLRRMARKRDVPEEEIALIEEVDIVGDASHLLDLVRLSGFTGRVRWIVSSHNFEHLPDPVRFLCDCEQLLEPGGTLAMIVPDKRYTFDRFQPAATVADMLHSRIAGPGSDDLAWSSFRQQSLACLRVDTTGGRKLSWSTERNDPSLLRAKDPRRALAILREDLAAGAAQPEFHGHRWRFTPAVFELIVLDLRAMGFISMEAETFPADGVEFSVLLRTCPPWNPSSDEYVAKRSALCLRIEDESARVTAAFAGLERELEAARAELAKLRAAGGA